ncbi:methyltransferase family protein [Deinococcus soli (ex Cha et al. 2016)]|uniref:methyltransferase family protein n=1 Tax=Deinococcus soli (ex Cha et al. 2016) TaxID=1309411 RepID=UPI001668024C|nr:isoprenylcysteine carboxylmethyltransferase family protein [Deinococcus soli (ex Cha et al. 2016)]
MNRDRALVAAQFALLAVILAGGRRGRGRPRSVRVTGAALRAGGLGLLVWSGRTLGRNLTPLPTPVAGSTLVQRGPYRHVRHPIYTALLLLAGGWTVARGGLVSVAGTFLLAGLLRHKAGIEDAALAGRHPDHAAYRARTGAFLPRTGRR